MHHGTYANKGEFGDVTLARGRCWRIRTCFIKLLYHSALLLSFTLLKVGSCPGCTGVVQLLQLICAETDGLYAQQDPLPMQKELGGQHVYCPLFGPEQQL